MRDFKEPGKAVRKIIYRLSCVCAALMLLALSFPVHAEETSYVLQINYGQDTDKGDIAPIKGACFTIYQVAVLTSKGYEYVEPYASVMETSLLDCGKDGSEMESLAKSLANVANHSGQSGVTDDSGQLLVPAKAGAYLVVQTGTVKGSTAQQYITASPFLVQVLRDGKITKAYPKTEKIKKNETKPDTKPDDNTQTTTSTNDNTGTTEDNTGTTEDNTTDDSSSKETTDKTGEKTDTGTTENGTSDSRDTGNNPQNNPQNNPPSRTEQTGDSPVPILLFAAGCGFLIIGIVINNRKYEK